MNTLLRYGKRGLPLEIADSYPCAELRLRVTPALADETESIYAALVNPIASPALISVASKRVALRGSESTVAITVSDITRPVPNNRILPPVLDVLNQSGISDKRITFVIGTGLHRQATHEEIDEILGVEIAARYAVVNHVARDEATLTYLGETSRGTPIWVNSAYLDADLRIAVSLIEPHFMAGFSGGRKAICPGLAGVNTMRVLHGAKILSHPSIREGVLDGNPFHEEATEIACRVGVDFSINVTLDEERRITGVYTGGLIEAHAEGCKAAARNATAYIDEPVDIVVTTSAGYPLDLTFYQSVKAMTAAPAILKPGGSLIIASSCDEGIGSADFERVMLETSSIREFREHLADPGFFIPDQWQLQMMCRALDHASVYYFTDHIDAATLRRLFVTPISSIEEGIRQAIATHGPGATIAVIPDGPYVMPRTAVREA